MSTLTGIPASPLPHTLYIRVPTSSNPRPRVTDLSEFEPTTLSSRTKQYLSEAASYMKQFNTELPRVAIAVKRSTGYWKRKNEIELFSVGGGGRMVKRGQANADPSHPLAPSTLHLPHRPPGSQTVSLQPVWMSANRPPNSTSRLFDLAYCYSLSTRSGSKWTFTWRVYPATQTQPSTLRLWAFQAERGEGSSSNGGSGRSSRNSNRNLNGQSSEEEELEYLVASFYYGKVDGGEVEGVLEMEDKWEAGMMVREEGEEDEEVQVPVEVEVMRGEMWVSADEALVGALEVLRFEGKGNRRKGKWGA